MAGEIGIDFIDIIDNEYTLKMTENSKRCSTPVHHEAPFGIYRCVIVNLKNKRPTEDGRGKGEGASEHEGANMGVDHESANMEVRT